MVYFVALQWYSSAHQQGDLSVIRPTYLSIPSHHIIVVAMDNFWHDNFEATPIKIQVNRVSKYQPTIEADIKFELSMNHPKMLPQSLPFVFCIGISSTNKTKSQKYPFLFISFVIDEQICLWALRFDDNFREFQCFVVPHARIAHICSIFA